jgi:hypothetical protein
MKLGNLLVEEKVFESLAIKKSFKIEKEENEKRSI